ncbi:hypothetical protein [Ensifer sp.]|jgi:hypothetical protein|uniref:hypothetical protein n=1 Tax=Ensifer sp. TaxID=1872086 RepID=UPI002E14072A|nr:hypothetical protein [Ensifer sp.]
MAEKLDERGDPQSATHDARRTTFSARETRQAGMGTRVFMVLAASLALVLLGWGAIELTDRTHEQPVAIDRVEQAPQVQP